MNRLLALLLVGFVVWWLFLRQPAAQTSAPPKKTTGGTGPSAAIVRGVQSFVAQAKAEDRILGDIDDSEQYSDFFVNVPIPDTDTDISSDAWKHTVYEWYGRWKRQLRDPASRVYLSDLTAYDLRLFGLFLSDALPRRWDKGATAAGQQTQYDSCPRPTIAKVNDDYYARIKDTYDALQTIAAIAAKVVDYYLGGTVGEDLNKLITTPMHNAMFQSFLQQSLPQLQGGDLSRAFPIRDGRDPGGATAIQQPIDPSTGFPTGNVYAFMTDPITGLGGDIFCRAGLFARKCIDGCTVDSDGTLHYQAQVTEAGVKYAALDWLFPWNSSFMNVGTWNQPVQIGIGCNSQTRPIEFRKVVLQRAKLYRLLDLVATQVAQPYKVKAFDQYGNVVNTVPKGLYKFQSAFGPVWGSIFAPTDGEPEIPDEIVNAAPKPIPSTVLAQNVGGASSSVAPSSAGSTIGALRYG